MMSKLTNLAESRKGTFPRNFKNPHDQKIKELVRVRLENERFEEKIRALEKTVEDVRTLQTRF